MANILLFNAQRKAKSEKSVFDDITDLEQTIERLRQQEKLIKEQIWATRQKLRELRNITDENINKIAFRKMSNNRIERVRILSLTYGNAYHAIKIKSDNSDSEAQDRFKRIYLNDYKGWLIESDF